MSLFDDLKLFLDEVIGPGTDISGNEFSGDSFDINRAITPESYSPDASKQFLQNQGFSQPPVVSPFLLPQDQTLAVIQDRPNPFNVIDLDTVALQYSQSGIAGPVQGNIQGSAALAVSQGTLQKLTAYLNASTIAVAPNSPANGFTNIVQQFARTVAISSPANFLRIERLPLGNSQGQYINTGNFSTSGPAKSSFIADSVTSWQANDSGVLGVTQGIDAIPDGFLQQAFASRILSGIFVQFDSTDNPVFRAKDFEEYKLPFQTVYITFFIYDLKWRIISGQKASITGGNLKNNRQQLHLWDGAGILDQDIYQPTPFSVQALPSTDATGNATAATIISNYDSGSLITPVTTQGVTHSCATNTYPTTANPDPLTVSVAVGNTANIKVGALITGANVLANTFVTGIIDTTHFTINQAATSTATNIWAFATLSGGSGLTTNKGYGVLWISGISLDPLHIPAGSAASTITYTLTIGKGFFDSTISKGSLDARFIETQNYITRTIVEFATGVTPAPTYEMNFENPIRVTLAGFDAQRRDFSANQQTGEVLFARLSTPQSPGSTITYGVNVRGYALGWARPSAATPTISTIACVPFNPYPADCVRSFPTPVA